MKNNSTESMFWVLDCGFDPKERAKRIIISTRARAIRQGYKSKLVFSTEAFEEICFNGDLNNSKSKDYKYWSAVMDEFNKLEKEGFYEKLESATLEICPVCKTLFVAKNGGHIFCTSFCNKKYNSLKNEFKQMESRKRVMHNPNSEVRPDGRRYIKNWIKN